MKRIFSKLGAIATIVGPVIAVVSCGDSDADVKYDFSEHLAKFVNATSSKSKEDLNASVGSKLAGADVTPAELGYAQPILSDNVTASYKVKTKFDMDTRQIVIAVKLLHDIQISAEKNIIIAVPIDQSYQIVNNQMIPIMYSDRALVQKAIDIQNTKTAADYVGQGIVTGIIKDGLYDETDSRPVRADDVLAPQTIAAIVEANQVSKIASSDSKKHYAILINLIRQELTPTEALAIHKAFAKANSFRQGGDTTTREDTELKDRYNNLNVRVLYTELSTMDIANEKLNLQAVFRGVVPAANIAIHWPT